MPTVPSHKLSLVVILTDQPSSGNTKMEGPPHTPTMVESRGTDVPSRPALWRNHERSEHTSTTFPWTTGRSESRHRIPARRLAERRCPS